MDDFKLWLDIGLGAVAIGLFVQQSRIFTALRTIVADHGRRITRLERAPRAAKAKSGSR